MRTFFLTAILSCLIFIALILFVAFYAIMLPIFVIGVVILIAYIIVKLFIIGDD